MIIHRLAVLLHRVWAIFVTKAHLQELYVSTHSVSKKKSLGSCSTVARQLLDCCLTVARRCSTVLDSCSMDLLDGCSTIAWQVLVGISGVDWTRLADSRHQFLLCSGCVRQKQLCEITKVRPLPEGGAFLVFTGDFVLVKIWETVSPSMTHWIAQL